jgi:tetratricopeptide (TPR) repeat protein
VAWATGPGGDAEIAIALAGATHHLWEAQGCNEEGDWLHRTVESWVDERVPPRLAARFWFAVSNLGLFTGLDRQAQAGLRAASLFRGLGDRYWLFRSLLSAAQKMTWAGRHAEAQAALTESKQLLDPNWPSFTQGFLEHGFGTFEYFAAADPGDARKHFEAVREIGRHCADGGFLEDIADFFLMMIDFGQGDFAAAAERGLQTIRRPVTRMGARNKTILQGTLGAALAGVGRMEEADEMLRATIPQARRALGSTTWLFNHIAFLVARQGRYEAAAKLLGHIDRATTVGVIAKSPSQRRSYAQALALTKSAIEEEDFSRSHAAGSALNEDDATALAFPNERRSARRAP